MAWDHLNRRVGSSIWQWFKSSEHQSEGLFEKENIKTIDWHLYSLDLSPT